MTTRTEPTLTPACVDRALRYLRRVDPIMGETISRVGPFAMKVQRPRFAMLIRSIISQQISTSAARTVRQRLIRTAGTLTPANIATLSMKQLRAAGLSERKAEFVRDLANKVLNGDLRLRSMGRLSDEEIIAELTQVRGIGVWTAQMFLMFALQRPDVFPIGDLGIRNGMVRLYGLNERPDDTTLHAIANAWSPFASVASWYCWRCLELPDSE